MRKTALYSLLLAALAVVAAARSAPAAGQVRSAEVLDLPLAPDQEPTLGFGQQWNALDEGKPEADDLTATRALTTNQPFQAPFLDDDVPSVGFSAPIYNVSESVGDATITVTLSNPYSATVTVRYATSDSSANAGSDYLAASGSLTFTPEITTQLFTVPVLDDEVMELQETVDLSLSQVVNGTLGLIRTATLAIVDDDGHYLFLPLAARGHPIACPTTSVNVYSAGTAFQVEWDDPVRPAYNHADKNIALRGYAPNDDPNLGRELVDYGSDDPTQPPQFATLFSPHRVPTFTEFHRVHNWAWAPSPDPGSRADPVAIPPVTALGMATTPGETLYVPVSGYSIGGGMEVLVLFADEDTVTLRYTRDDSSGFAGYSLHIDNICTDPNLLALYNTLDAEDGARYVFKPAEERPYSYDLPNLPAGHPIGTAREAEIVVAVVDTGTFQDPRSCNEWWQIRPGYTGACPPAR